MEWDIYVWGPLGNENVDSAAIRKRAFARAQSEPRREREFNAEEKCTWDWEEKASRNSI